MIHSTPVTGKHLGKVLLIAAVVLLWCGSSYAAAISSTAGGGNWSAGTSWVGGVVPTSADDVTIVNTATITVGTGNGVATPAQCNSLVVNGSLVFGSGSATIRQLNVTTNVTIAATGTITVNNVGAAQHNFFIDGNLTRNGGTFTMLSGPGSVLVTFDGGGAQVIGGTSANITFNNVTLNNATGSLAAGGSIATITAATFTHSNGTFTPPAALNITGDYTLNGGTFTSGAGTVTFNGAGAQQINGGATSLTFNNLTVNKAGGALTTGGGIATITANIFTLTAGTVTLPATFSASSNIVLTTGTLNAGAAINVGGNFQKAAAVTFVPGSGTVTFNGGAAQAINGTTVTQTFNNIVVTKAGASILSVAGSTTGVNAGDITVNSGTFTGPATLAAAGTVTLNGGTFGSGANTRIGGDWINNGGAFTVGVSTVTFNGAVDQLIGGTAVTQTFNDFTVNKAGGTLTVGGSTTTLNIGLYTNTLGNFTGPPTLNISSNLVLTAGTFTGGAQTNAGGAWTNNGGTFIGGTGTVTFNAGVNQGINGTATTQTFNNIIINKAGGTVAAGGSTTTINANNLTLTTGLITTPANFTASGNVLLTAGTLTSGASFSVGGDWTNNGGTFTPAAGTVIFNGAGSQTINGSAITQTFTNLNVNKGGGTLTVSGSTTTVNATTLTMTAGAFTAAPTMGITTNVTLTSGTLTGGTSMTVGGNWTNNGGTYSGGSGTVTFNSGAAQAINGTAAAQYFNNITINKAAGAFTVGGSTTSLSANNFTLTLGTFTAPATLIATGTILQSAGTLTAGANITVGGDWTHNGGVFTPGAGTVTFNGSGAQDIDGTVVTQTFANLTVNKSGGTLNVSGTTTAVSASNLTMNAGTFAAPATVTLTGSATLNGGTLTAGANTNVAGNFTNNGGTFTGGAGTVTLNGAGAQSIDGTAISQSFNNLTLNKAGGTVSSGGNVVTINTANLTQTAGNFTAPATLNTTGNLLITAGTFTAGSTINLGGNLTHNGGTLTAGTGTVNFNGAAQTIGGALAVNLFNVATSGTTAVSTAIATTLGGNLLVGNNTSFGVGGFNFSVAGTTTIGGGTLGILTIAAGGTKTFTGLVTIAATGTWNNSGNAPVTFRGGITASGTFSAGSSTQTFDTNVQILNGTLSIATMDVVGISLINNGNLTSTTALNGATGNLTQGSGAALTISGTSAISGLNASNSGNTVTYNGTSQAIFPTTFHNLTINQAGATTATIGGATRVNGALTLSSGNVSLGNNILTLGPSSTAPAPVGFILASAGGEVRKEYNGTGTFTFPIGDNTGSVDSSPIQVNVTAGAFSSAYVSVRVVNAKHPDNASGTNYLNRYWIVSQLGITGAVANITGTFVGTDVSGVATSAAGAYLSGTFGQTSNPWVKDVALTATTMSLTNVPLAAGVNTACTGITLAPPTVGIIGGGVTVCAGTPVSLSTSVTGDATIVYSWTPLTGLSSSTISNPVATPLVTTPYTVTIRDGNGITNTANTTITVNPTPNVLAAPVATVICTGAATNIALSNPNATPGTAYTWTVVQSGVTGASNQVAPVAGPIAQVLTASGTIPGTVTYSIVPVAGTCNGTPVNVIITVNPTPTVTTPANQAVCNTASTAAVNFSGTATAYNWVNDTPSIGLGASGTGNIASFAATNAGATVVIATVTVTPTYTFGAVTCPGTPQIFTITVNPTPTVVAVGNQVVCNGANTTAITFSGAVAGTSYNWTNTNTSIGLAASGTGNIPVFAGVNTGSAPVGGTITVTPVFAGCSGTPQVFTITVNPTPNVADPVDQVLCNTASTAAVTFVGTVGGTTYNWTNDTPSIGLAGSGAGNIGTFVATNGGTTPVIATIMVTPSTAGPVCTGTPQSFTITVNPTPTVVAPGNQVVCNGASTTGVTFTGAVAGTTFNWSNNTTSIGLAASGTGNIGVFTGVNATGVPVMATITVTPVFAGCVGTPQNFTITVNPTPTVVATANQVVCNGANTTAITFTGTAGATFSWTNDTPGIGLLASGTGNIGAFAATNAGTIPVVATITVTPSTAGPVCTGTPQTFTITVNPTPTVTTPANQAVCNTASTAAVNFSGTATAYNWVNDTPSIGLGASGTGNIASFAATNAGATVVIATVTVTPTYTFGAVTCPGTPQIFTITVNPTPTVVAVGNQVVCNGANTTAITFSGAVAGTSYNWTNTNTSIGLAASGTGNIPVFAGVNTGSAPVGGTITVTPVFAGCSGTPQVFTITVNPTPNVADPVDQVLCNTASTAAVTFVGTVGGTTYNWTNDTPSIGLAGSGAGNIGTFVATNGGTTPVIATIMVTPSTAGPVCTGTPQSFTITVNPTPTVVAPGNQVVCNGASTTGVTFTGAVAGTTFNWSNNTTSIGLAASGTGNIGVFTGVNATGVPVMATITVTPVFAGCVGTPQNFTITVNPTPTVVATANQVVCNGANTTAITFTGTAGATFSWTNDTPGIGLLASGTGNIGAFAATNAGTIPVVATITVTPSTAGPVCTGTPQTFTITVNPTPTVTTPANQAVCNTASTAAVNFSGTATAYNWVNDTPSIGLGASGTGNIASFAATNAGATVVIATVTVTPTYTFGAVTCPGTPQIFTITVNPTPTVVAVGNQVVCNGANTTAITFSGAVAGTSYNWTNTNTSIGLAASGTGNIPVFAGVNTGSAPVGGTITVTPVFAGCSGTPQVFTITVNPTPNVADPVDQVLCNTASTAAVTFVGTVGGTTYNWTNDTPSIGLAGSGAGNIGTFVATNGGTTPVIATIMVTPSTAGPVCTGTPQSFTITVNPTPTVVAPGNQVVCNGASTTGVTFTGAVAGTTFNWSNNTTSIGLAASGTGNIGVFTGVNATGVPVMATITVTPVFAGCVGTPQNFTITVNPTPTVVATANQVVCNGANTTAITFTGTAGATFSWTNDTPGIGLLASGTGNIGAFAATNAGTIPVVATITVTPSTAGPVCTGTPQTFTITVNPTPTVTTPANQAVCNTASTAAVNFSGTATAYNWVNDTPSIGLGASGTGNIASFAATNAGATVVIATVTVTPTYTFGAVTCPGTPQIFTITVNPTPTVVAVGNQVVCNGANTTAITFSGAVAGTSYNWTNTNTSIGLAASGTGNIPVFAGVNTGSAPVGGTITVTPVFAGCSGTPQVFTITVNPTPNVADPVDQVLCNTASTAAVTFVGTVGGTTYNWTNDTPSIGLAGSGAGNIGTFVATNGGTTPVIATIMVTPSTAGPVCTGTPQSFTITVNPTPTVVAPGNQVVCNGASTTGVTFTGAVAGTTFNWSNNTTSIGLAASGTGNIGVFTGVNATGVPVMATITVTPVFAGCVGTPQNFTITVNPTPTVVATANQVVCNGANTTAITFTGTAGATFSWTNDTPGIGLLASGTGNIGAFAATNAGTIPVVATITVTPSTAGPVCTGTPQTFTITVNPTPTVTTPANQAVCNTASTAAVNFSGTATAYNWVNDTPSIGLGASGTGNIASFAATNAGATVVIATVTVTPTYTFGAVTCPGTPQIFTITVNPTPTVVAVGNQVVCNGANTTAITFSGAVAGTSYNWTNTNTSIGLAASGTGNIPVFAGVNTGSAPVGGTITVTPVFAGCSGTPQVFTITVNPTPNVADPVDQVLCNTASTAAVTFVGTVGGTTYNWTNDTPSIGLAGSGAGNIGTFVATNGGTTPVIATIMVTPSTAGPVCTGTPQSFTITVNPTPTVVAPGNQVVCNGASTTGVTFTGAVAGTTFNWSNNTTSIGLAASGTGNIGVFTGVNATGVPVMATITVTPVFAGCVGTPQNFTITVNPTPTVVATANQVVCNGANTTAITFTGTAGATFSWTNDTPGIGLLASGTGNIGAFAATNAGTIPVVATITVTPSTAGPVCTGTPQTFTITVNPTPTVTTPANQAVCNTASTAAVNFSGTATAYNWVNDTPSIGLGASGTGNIASFAATNAGATVVIATVTVTPTYTFGAVTCPGTPQIFTITVNPTPTVVAIGNQGVCTGTSTALVTFSGAVAGTTFNWANDTPSIGLAPSGTGNIAAFTAFNASAAPVIATITVTPVYAGCAGTPKSFTITVDPNPVVTAGQAKTICSGQNVNYKVTLTPAGLPAGSTFSWAAPTMSDASVQGSAGVTVPESNPLTLTDILVNTGAVPITATYNIVPNNGSCTGATVAVVITVNPVPVGVPVLSASCSDVAIGSANVLTTTGGSVSAANFTIATNPNGLTQSAGTTSAGTLKGPNELIDDAWTNVTGADVDIVYTITPFTSAGCQGANFIVRVTIHAEPVSGPVAPAALCSDTAVGYTLATPLAATYNISTNSNGLVQSAGTVSAGNGKLAAELADDQWTNINNAFPSINVVYTVTPITAIGCAGNSFTVTVPVKPEPRGANSGTTICSSISATPVNYNLQLTNINGLGNGMASTFAWSAPVDNTNVTGESLTPQAGPIINDILVNPTGVDQVVTYQVTPTGSVSGCLGDLFTIAVTVKPSPIGVNQAVATCSDVSPNYNLLNNIAILGNNVGSTFSWVAASNGNVTGESTSPVVGPRITDVLNNITNGDEIVDYTVTPTGVNGCLGAPFIIQVTVHPEPVGSSIAAPDICSGSPVNYNLQNNVNTNNSILASFLWMAVVDNPNVTGESMFTQTTVSISDVLINTSFVQQTVTYTVTPTSSGSTCAGDPFTITVNVYPKAQVSAGVDIDVCANVPTVTLQGVTTFAPNGVSWGGGPGTYAPGNNVDMPVYTHGSNPPLDAVITQTLTLTANDPDGPGPCGVVNDVMTLRINGLPNINFSGLPISYAENKPPVALTGTQNGGNFSPGVGTALGSTTVNGSGFDEVIFDPSVAAVNQYDTIFYRWIDPTTGCQGQRLQRVFVSPVTVIDFGMEYDCGTLGFPGTGCIPIAKNVGSGEFQFCANVGYIRLVGDPDAPSGDPAGTNFTAVGANAAVLAARILSSSNEWYIDTNGLPSDVYLIQYNYLDLSTGNPSTPVVYPIRVWAAPTASIIAPANNCITSAVNLSSSSGMTSPNPFGGSIGLTTWNFGDFPTPGTASGTSVSYNYTSPGSYTVTLNVVTNNLCRDTDTFTLQVGSPPIVWFDFGAICTNDQTNYFDASNPGISTITNYTWAFGDGDILTGPAGGSVPLGTHGGRTGGTYKNPTHNFVTSGGKSTILTVDTNDGCSNSANRTVNILLGGVAVAPTPTSPYSIDFESGTASWIAEGLVISPPLAPPVTSPISWILGTPTGAAINMSLSGTSVWWTGDNIVNNGQPSYYDLESSVVNGPCFDLTNLQRPMIEFDYWSDAEKNLDGAVLQYSINGGANWSLVGPASGFSGVQRDQGINWYDPSAIIVSNPGQQVPTSTAAYGWTDKSGGWKRAKFNLDMVPPGISRQQVRVRIAFASNNQNAPGNTFDGFAFDNVWVGEKSRRVLVENFTNSPTNPTLDQTWLNARYAQQQVLRGPGGSDFYYVNYHIAIPTPDPLNLDNQADPGARSLFMGVSSSQTIIDGIIDNVKFTGAFTDLDANGVEADRRALVNPQFALVLDTVATGNPNTIKANLTLTALQATTDPLLVQVLLVEDQVGTFPYRNVVRKQLLGADGVTVSQVFAPTNVRVVNGNEVTINAPITNAGMLTLVGYVQNKNTREIYQSVIQTGPIKHGVVVTGLEDKPLLQPSTLNGITMYPNPANGKVFLGVPDSTPMDGFSWKLIDQRGIMVKSGDFTEAINGVREISVGDLANGMYIMQLTGPGYSVVHRKLMVMNRN